MPDRGLPARRLLSLVLAAIACVPLASAAVPAGELEVVASNLDNPRKLFIAADGAIYVAQAGRGGRDKCLGTGANRACIGLTGSIARIANGVTKRVLTGLWSGASPDGRRAQGPADTVVRGGLYYVLLQDATIDARGANSLGPDGAVAGDLISSPPGRASPAVIVNLAAFEAARNPDRGAGSNARVGSPPLDSNPYAFAEYRGGFAVVDAGGNDLLWIGPKGGVSVLAVFPPRAVALSRAVAKQIGRPGVSSIPVQAVPSSVAVGPDGALYVGELTGVPFKRGMARIWRVTRGGTKTLYATGFTNISDLAFDGDDLLVLEIAANGLLDPSSPGALIRRRARTDAARSLRARGWSRPPGSQSGTTGSTSRTTASRRVSGPGPHGELVRLPR